MLKYLTFKNLSFEWQKMERLIIKENVGEWKSTWMVLSLKRLLFDKKIWKMIVGKKSIMLFYFTQHANPGQMIGFPSSNAIILHETGGLVAQPQLC